MLKAILKEIDLQKDYLKNAPLETIYLGGGTPSVLSVNELGEIFEKLNSLYKISEKPEITLEANPDDLSQEYLKDLKNYTPINRLSIGVQSFSEEDLLFMNRAHNAIEAKTCIEYAQDIGFDNLTIDLIYGSPTTSNKDWQKNLKTAFEYDIPHISCYALTVEKGTALNAYIKKGEKPAPTDDKTIQQFEILMREMQRFNYIYYEISNFAQPNNFALHNSNYWKGVPYLGIGPSAHSFNGTSRQWNIAHNAKYIKSLDEGIVPFEIEELTTTQRYNEYVMTSLRTVWGCDPAYIHKHFGKEYVSYFNKHILPFVQHETVETDGKKYFLTNAGKLLADKIAMELFY